MDPLENGAVKLNRLIEQTGINPIYIFLVAVIILVLQRKKIKNLKNLKPLEKLFLIATIICLVVSGIFTAVHILVIM